jgi:hypothetical protein
MRTFFAACLLALPVVTACAPDTPRPFLPKRSSFDTKRPLSKVDLDYPNVTFTFLSTNEEHKSGEVFSPPKTIDCSKLALTSDAFEDAIKAGALILKIQTPTQIKQTTKDKDGKEITTVIDIKSSYGGVLALCKVSDRAKGPDSRIYRIRGLDDYLVKGKDGNISVVGAVLDYGKKTQADRVEDRIGDRVEDRIGDMLKIGVLGDIISQNSDLISDKKASSTDYSWMLWLTDRTTTFTNYKAELARSKADKAKK